MFTNIKKPLFIWTYHRILPEEGSAAVSTDIFQKQIDYLLDKKYNFITTEELLPWFNGQLDPNKKYTMLTFDDGWADNYFYAQPILAKYDIRAVLPINTGLIDTNSTQKRSFYNDDSVDSKQSLYNSAYNLDKSAFLTKQEIISMHKSGVWDIQPHGSSHFGSFHSLKKIRGFFPEYDHWTMRYALDEPTFCGAPRAEFKSTLAAPRTHLAPHLKTALKNAKHNQERMKICQLYKNPIQHLESQEKFIKRITKDMQECKNWISTTINKDCNSMFWPWGHYSTDSVKVAKKLGFDLIFTMNKAAVTATSSQFEIPRIAAPTTLKRFIHQEKVFSSQIKTAIRNLFSK
jgi:peptidoglycan/xylan/chitin deacetylase (PgdA/CDA1 family)